MLLKTKKKTFALLWSIVFSFLGVSSSVFAVWTPPHLFNQNEGGYMGVASDANGNAIYLYTDSDVFTSVTNLFASYYTGGVWQTPQLLDTDPDDIFDVGVAMNASGSALAIWRDFAGFTLPVKVAQFSGGSWNTPLILGMGAFAPSIAINDNGDGVAIWNTNIDNSIQASFFSGGVWSTPVNISGVTPVSAAVTSVAYSANGSVVAGWFDFSSGVVTANNFVNGSWGTAQVLGATPAAFPVYNLTVGIDAQGKALALWEDASTLNVVSSYFDGLAWQPVVNVSTSPGNNQNSTLAMSPNGTAIAAWPDSSFNGLSSVFNGTSWGPPTQFGSNLLSVNDSNINPVSQPFANIAVAMNPSGDAFVAWTTGPDLTHNYSLFSAQLPAGGVWTNDELIYMANFGADEGVSQAVESSFSNNGARFVVFQTVVGEGFTSIWGAASPGVPTGLKGKSCKNKFATQTESVKTITWTPSLDPTVAYYQLNRNGKLIATIPAKGPFVYRDHGRCKGLDVYSLTVFYSNGLTSELTVSVK